jgi:hypothetical protein
MQRFYTSVFEYLQELPSYRPPLIIVLSVTVDHRPVTVLGLIIRGIDEQGIDEQGIDHRPVTVLCSHSQRTRSNPSGSKR